MDESPSILKSTLIGGLVFGVAGGLPIVGAINCACCALVIGAGFLAAYLHSGECRKAGSAFGPKGGATVGLVAGLFYTLAMSVVQLPFRPGPEKIDEILSQFETMGAPPEAMDIASRVAPVLTSATGIILLFLFWLLVAAVFSTLGGVIGGVAFKVEPAPPAPSVTPSAGFTP
jgi:hypothetical protein